MSEQRLANGDVRFLNALGSREGTLRSKSTLPARAPPVSPVNAATKRRELGRFRVRAKCLGYFHS